MFRTAARPATATRSAPTQSPPAPPAPAAPSQSSPSRSGWPWHRTVRPLVFVAVAPLLRWIVAVEAVPPGCPRRYACDQCGTHFGPGGRLRALGPTAHCGGCGARVGAPAYALELALLGAAAAVVLAGRPALESAALAWWGLCAVPLAFVDAAVHRLPDRLTYPAVAGTWALLGIAALADGTGSRHGGSATSWPRAVIAGTVVALLFAATALLFGRRGFGLGDAKLALSATAVLGWLGWGSVLAGLMVAFAASAVASVALLATRRVRWSGHVPFGPFFVLGTLVALALAAR